MSERPQIDDPEALAPDARLHHECKVAFEFDLEQVNVRIAEHGSDVPPALLDERAKIQDWIDHERGELAKLLKDGSDAA